MYVNIGSNRVVKEQEIIGFFDIENTTVSKRTRDFLNIAEKKKNLENIAADLPKSFIVCSDEKGKKKVYLSQLLTSTLVKRIEEKEI